jgi:hypothetical protein
LGGCPNCSCFLIKKKKKKKKKKTVWASTEGGWSCAAKLVQSYQTLAKASS